VPSLEDTIVEHEMDASGRNDRTWDAGAPTKVISSP
jgi:hypothetical protein